ncbi:hypothetical protein [Leucobacter chromiiresistens]|nr:hypothetical protein [Leucobacter chromiiresistens]
MDSVRIAAQRAARVFDQGVSPKDGLPAAAAVGASRMEIPCWI